MPKTILIADDSPSMRQMIGFTLKQAGFATIDAHDGKDALDRLTEEKVDMLITDLNMPKLDGISLIKSARRLPNSKFMPIVMLTTESAPEKKLEAKNAGATGWIVKPFTPDQLVTVVNKVLR